MVFDWSNNLIIPALKYLISPAVGFSIVLWIFSKTFKLGQFTEKVNSGLKKIGGLDKSITKINRHLTIIKVHLADKSGLDMKLFIAHSPVSLTTKGKDIIINSKFDKKYQKNKQWFVNGIKELKHETLAEIDESTIKFLYENQEESKKLGNIKDIAFKTGIPVDVLLRVYAIYLRNHIATELKVTN